MLLKVGAQGAPHHLKRDQPPWDVHFLGDGVNPPLQKALGSSGDCASGTLALTMRREHERIGRCVRTYLPPSLNDRNNVVGNFSLSSLWLERLESEAPECREGSASAGRF